MLQLYTFGGLRIEQDEQPLRLPTQKARDLLAYLITFRHRPHPRSVLVGILWPQLPEAKARRRLSDVLWRIRRVVGESVAADDERIWLIVDRTLWLDVDDFVAHTEIVQTQEPVTSEEIHQLRQAVDLYRGDFLDGFYQDWVLLEQERLRGRYLRTLERLLSYHKQTTNYRAALRVARRLAAVEPLHEATHREVMRLYHLLGRDAEAIAQYERCRRILREEMELDPAPETVALYETLQASAPGAPQPSTHLPTAARRPVRDLDDLPLVGRDEERAALLGHLESAAGGQGGMVLLEGEPGIGKSRLARELVAGARWRDIAIAFAPAGESVTSSYALLQSLLTEALSPLRIRQLMHLMDPDTLQALAPLLPSLAPEVPDRPPELPPRQARERLQQALIDLFLGLARIAPHFWVLEDLQWADAETLHLLPLLCPYLDGSRSLFLLTGRSAELRANRAAWEILQALDRVATLPCYRLDRLSREQVDCLVWNLLAETPPALSECLLRESEGVPLYIVEILKTWQDEGYLIPDEGAGWRWREDVLDAPLPPMSEAIIDHRLSTLSPAAEGVLEAAAAIGVEVDFDLLAQVCDAGGVVASEDHPERYLQPTDDLLRSGFLIETEAGYRFSHEQVRRAVYDRLSLTRRQRFHRRIARAMEELFPERFEALAHHFIGAGEREPAVHYLKRAADRACDLFAHQAALEWYDRLLDLLPRSEQPVDRYEVLRDRAEVLGWIGEREAQGQDLEEMLELARALGDGARRAEGLHLRSEWYRLQGQYGRASEDAQAALEIYRALGDDAARAALLTQLGWNIVYTGEYAQAASYFQAALPIYRSLNDLHGQINCLSGLTAAAELEGDYLSALSSIQENMALAEATGDAVRIARAHHNLGVIHYDLGDLESAEAQLRQALRIKESTGDRRSQALSRLYLGTLAMERGDLEAARTELEAALQTFRQVQDVSWETEARAKLGRLALREGDPTASDILRSTYHHRRELDEPAYAVIDLSYLALAELVQGDRAEAWRHSQKAVDELEDEVLGVEHPQRIYWNHHLVAAAICQWTAARVGLEKAAQVVDERAELIEDPARREQYRTGLRVNRAITEAVADQPPAGQLRVRLARADAPAHRRPTPEETVEVIWTVDAGVRDTALGEREGRVTLRRRRIVRLVAEAEDAGALPTLADLAGALQVSERTIRNDLSALREQGHAVPTRGSRA